MSEVFRLGLPITEKMVLLKLADHADDDGGNTYPAVNTIAHQASLSRRTVQKVLKAFVDSGVLMIEKHKTGGRGKTRVYRIDIKRAQALHPLSNLSREKKGVGNTPNEPLKGAEKQRNGASGNEKGCTSFAPESSLTENKNARARGGATEVPAAGARWGECQAALREAVGVEVYKMWLKPVVPVNDFGGKLTLAVPSRFLLDKAGVHLETIERVTDRKVEIIISSVAA